MAVITFPTSNLVIGLLEFVTFKVTLRVGFCAASVIFIAQQSDF